MSNIGRGDMIKYNQVKVLKSSTSYRLQESINEVLRALKDFL